MFPLVQPRGAVVKPKATFIQKNNNGPIFCLKNWLSFPKKSSWDGTSFMWMDPKMKKGGVKFAGYGVWFGPNDERNKELPLTVHEKQTITRAELTAALHAIKNKTPGKPLLIVSDSELVCVGLQSKCEKWARHKWVGSRGPLAHKDLWTELWERWQLPADSVEILWVPSHVGVAGNEEADVRAAKGAKQALHDVQKAKQVTDIWEELGLEEMPDSWDTDSNRSRGSGVSSDCSEEYPGV